MTSTIIAPVLGLLLASPAAAEMPALLQCETHSMVQVLEDGSLGSNGYTQFMLGTPVTYIVDTATGFIRSNLGEPLQWHVVQEGSSAYDFVAQSSADTNAASSILRIRVWQQPVTFLMFDQNWVTISSGLCDRLD